MRERFVLTPAYLKTSTTRRRRRECQTERDEKNTRSDKSTDTKERRRRRRLKIDKRARDNTQMRDNEVRVCDCKMLLPLAFGEHHGHPVPIFSVQFCQRGKLRTNPTVVRRPVELARDQRDVQRFPRRIFRQRSLEFVLVRLVLGVRDGGETDGKCAFVLVVVIFFTITTTRAEEDDDEEENTNAHILSSIRPSLLLFDASCSRASRREVYTCIKMGNSIFDSLLSLLKSLSL